MKNTIFAVLLVCDLSSYYCITCAKTPMVHALEARVRTTASLALEVHALGQHRKANHTAIDTILQRITLDFITYLNVSEISSSVSGLNLEAIAAGVGHHGDRVRVGGHGGLVRIQHCWRTVIMKEPHFFSLSHHGVLYLSSSSRFTTRLQQKHYL